MLLTLYKIVPTFQSLHPSTGCTGNVVTLKSTWYKCTLQFLSVTWISGNNGAGIYGFLNHCHKIQTIFDQIKIWTLTSYERTIPKHLGDIKVNLTYSSF
jgi:hypothetical protein